MARTNQHIPTTPNKLDLVVRKVKISPHAVSSSGSLDMGMRVQLYCYDLDTILSQLLEDYSEEVILKRISDL